MTLSRKPRPPRKYVVVDTTPKDAPEDADAVDAILAGWLANAGRAKVRGPADPAQARALKRAIVRDLAELAVDLLAEGKLPPAEDGPLPRRAPRGSRGR